MRIHATEMVFARLMEPVPAMLATRAIIAMLVTLITTKAVMELVHVCISFSLFAF